MNDDNIELLLLSMTGPAVGALIFGFDLLTYVLSVAFVFWAFKPKKP